MSFPAAPLALAWRVDLADPDLAAGVSALRARLRQAGVLEVEEQRAEAVLVWADRPGPALSGLVNAAGTRPGAAAGSGGFSAAHGRPIVLAGPTLELADPQGLAAAAAGLSVGGTLPEHDVRLLAGPDGGALESGLAPAGPHLGRHVHITDRVIRVQPVADDVRVLLTARLGLVANCVAGWRPSTGVLAWTIGGRPDSLRSTAHLKLLLLALRLVTGRPAAPAVRVGLLGYGAIGNEHNRAIRGVPGLELVAICDRTKDRLTAALALAPAAVGHDSAEGLLADDDVDLVVVSTPPNSHARWALAALGAGKHVIVEKPFAIRPRDADRVLEAAADRNLLAAVYQNRRFDPDHLAVRRAVTSGALGDLFHAEAFVGGYGHPCNLWHSDREVSGGAVYDWGAHVLDQLLDLFPQQVLDVTAREQKRVWLDVTNADHVRVTVAFEGGAEASFVYSDLAAALKPRWYLLGTRGGLVGQWRTERVVSRNDIGTLAEDVLAPADSPPVLDLHAADGTVSRLATPAGPEYQFHTELADALQLGLPMTVTAAQSRRVLGVLAAATASAAAGGRPVQPE